MIWKIDFLFIILNLNYFYSIEKNFIDNNKEKNKTNFFQNICKKFNCCFKNKNPLEIEDDEEEKQKPIKVKYNDSIKAQSSSSIKIVEENIVRKGFVAYLLKKGNK
jgi:hypothetical protein